MKQYFVSHLRQLKFLQPTVVRFSHKKCTIPCFERIILTQRHTIQVDDPIHTTMDKRSIMKIAFCTFILLLSELRSLCIAQEDVDPASNNVIKNNTYTANIVGGQIASGGTYLFYAYPASRKMLCGATLIHPDILITAAHCNGILSNFISPGLFFSGASVHIGGRYIDGSDAIDTIEVDLIRTHPGYSIFHRKNDLALIKLKTPSSAALAKWNLDVDVPANSTDVTVIGFGATSSGGYTSNNLLTVNLKTVDYTTCKKSMGFQLDKRTMMCAYALGKDSCQGDSGGPLLKVIDATNNGTNTSSAADPSFLLVGVVSWGFGCANAGFPGVYANVATNQDFVRNGICELSDSPPDYCLLTDEDRNKSSGICNTCGGGVLLTGTQLRKWNRASNVCRETCITVGVFAWTLLGWECGSCP